jgi:hypothetical protein
VQRQWSVSPSRCPLGARSATTRGRRGPRRHCCQSFKKALSSSKSARARLYAGTHTHTYTHTTAWGHPRTAAAQRSTIHSRDVWVQRACVRARANGRCQRQPTDVGVRPSRSPRASLPDAVGVAAAEALASDVLLRQHRQPVRHSAVAWVLKLRGRHLCRLRANIWPKTRPKPQPGIDAEGHFLR